MIEWEIEQAVDEEQLIQLHNICRWASRAVYDIVEKNSGVDYRTLELMLSAVLIESTQELSRVFQEITMVAMERAKLEDSRYGPDGSDWQTNE